MTMTLLDAHDTRGLRRFCVTMAVAVPVIFWLFLPWLFDWQRSPIPLYIGAAFLAVGAVAPRASYPVYRTWMALSHALGWLNTRLILGLVFFAMIAPFGQVLRRLGKLQYTRGPDSRRDSYRKETRRQLSAEDLNKPY